MDELEWNQYTADAIKAEELYKIVTELCDAWPKEMRISKARLMGIINDEEVKLIRRFYN